jgi:hypothetical protein
MGTHRLKDIAIVGRENALALDFDLYNLGRVVRVHLFLSDTADPGSMNYTMEIQAEYEDGKQRGIVTLEFSGLSAAALPQMTPTFYFGE